MVNGKMIRLRVKESIHQQMVIITKEHLEMDDCMACTFRSSLGETYIGDWLDGTMHGRGIYIFSNGNKYDGEWVNDSRTGYGVYRYNNGELYEGYFIKGERNGEEHFAT